MKVTFNPKTKALRICAKDTTDAMALMYWEMEFRKHGPSMLEIVTELPDESTASETYEPSPR